MRWLIVEDSLQGRKGHWFEYLQTIRNGLVNLGDEVTILADKNAEPFLVDQLGVRPCLPNPIFLQMSDGSGRLKRYWRIPRHAWQTYRTMRALLAKHGPVDVILVPTVLVHHLLGWVWLIRRDPVLHRTKTILFFPGAPITLKQDGQPAWEAAPTAKLFRHLIKSLKSAVAEGRVILGVETEPMRRSLTELTGVPFTYFPHPVAPVPPAPEARDNSTDIVMGSYGGVRPEKGTDCLIAAVDEHCRRFPESQVRFAIQSVGGEREDWKQLEENPRVQLIPHYFVDGEYARRIRSTSLLLLPYRRSSYSLRVSRVVVEAMVNGLPVVAARGTTLESQAAEFGAGIPCEDGNPASLVEAIRQAEMSFPELSRKAQQRAAVASKHFSVETFRDVLRARAGETPQRAHQPDPELENVCA